MRCILQLGCLLIVPVLVIPASLARSIDDRHLADESNTSEWLAYGRTHSEQRFSPLTQVNSSNVKKLQVDWFLDLPNDVGLAATPLVVEGVMYFTGNRNNVRAVSATTGRVIWRYDPKVEETAGQRLEVAYLHGSRGVAYWNDKVYLATRDGMLIALEAKTGKEVWRTMTVDPTKALYISGAPKVFKGKVLIGNGGTENGATRGYVTAYDAETGKQAWRFYIVPGNPADGFENKTMEMAARTWTGEWWKYGGGGNAWHGFTYDPEFDALYIGTGNGSPWNQKIRSPGGGDNLFLCSIVALDPDTGEYRWHYQTTPGETWDYNSNMDIVLADLKINGKVVKALMHAPKNGFFYVINRATGKLISAEPIADVSWASKIDLKTGRPVELPGARYMTQPASITPGPLGAHNWPSMSFNPDTGLAYIPTIHQYYTYSDEGIDLKSWKSPDWQATNLESDGTGVAAELVEYKDGDHPGSLQAWDPINQQQVWEVPLEVAWNPGTLTTAGNLVFQGTADGVFAAYDAKTGKTLWQYKVGLGIAAPPITYAIEGRQYVALLVGWGSIYAALGGVEAANLGWSYGSQMRRLVTFSLDGKTQLPSQPGPRVPVPLDAPYFEVNAELALSGAPLFSGKCAFCHGYGAVSGGSAPDLRASPIAIADQLFDEVVRKGAKRSRGMPAFESLTDSQLQSLQHFIREQANMEGTPATQISH